MTRSVSRCVQIGNICITYTKLLCIKCTILHLFGWSTIIEHLHGFKFSVCIHTTWGVVSITARVFTLSAKLMSGRMKPIVHSVHICTEVLYCNINDLAVSQSTLVAINKAQAPQPPETLQCRMLAGVKSSNCLFCNLALPGCYSGQLQ